MNTSKTPAPDYDCPLPTERERAYTQTITGTELEPRAVDLAGKIVIIFAFMLAAVTFCLAIYGGIRLIDKVM